MGSMAVAEVTRFPWEAPPSEVAPPTDNLFVALQADVRYMVSHTAVLVRSNQPALEMLVNTARGQDVPRGQCKFTDGSTFELQDIGMPQPNSPELTIPELMACIWDVATKLGLELEP